MKSIFTLTRTMILALALIMAHAGYAQLGNGWNLYSPKKIIHLDDQDGLQTFSWTSYKSVCTPICADYSYDAATNSETFRILNTKSNRSEIRLQNEYATGSRQFEGYVTFNAPLDDESLMQIFGSTSGATQMMLRGYAADGGSIRGAGKTVATNVYGKEVRVNVIHLQEDVGNKIQIYIDGVKMAEIADNEAVTNYHKYGNYGTMRTGEAVVKWRNCRFFRDGTAPGTTVSAAITSPANGTIFNAPATVTIDANAFDTENAITKVEFFNGSAKIGEDLTSPYSFTWNNVAAGNYNISAKATNSLGLTSLPATVSITVSGPPTSSFDITDNGGVITAQYANTSKPTENFPSLIDNTSATKYFISNRTALWTQYKSSVPAIVVAYTITSANDVPTRDPKNWNLQGSNNGSSWVTIDARSNETFATRFLKKTYTFTNTTSYLYYRLNITANASAPGTQFAEWELFERRNQTITFDDLPAKTYGDEPFELNATSTSDLPVTFEIESGPATLNGDTLTLTGAGTVTIKALQPGTTNYFPATPVVKTLIVNKAIQNLIFDSIETKTYGDAPFELSVDTDTDLPVTFQVISGPASISGSMLTIEGAGSITVRATQAGNDNYLEAFVEQTFTVNKAAQTINFETISTKTYGDAPFDLIATVNTGLPLVFEIISGPASVSGSTLTITGAGSVTVKVSQAGNQNYLAASEEQTFIVNKAAQTISFAAITPKNEKDQVQLAATSTSGLPVSFVVISGPGKITSGNKLSFTGEGQVVIQAQQAGDDNYLPAASVNQTVLVYADDEKHDGIRITVYPNPTQGVLKVKLDNKDHEKKYTLMVFDSNGNVVESNIIQKNDFKFEIDFDLSNNPNGIYYLHVFDGTQTLVRIIKKGL